jgi:ketol-acid reductoisomerase
MPAIMDSTLLSVFAKMVRAGSKLWRTDGYVHALDIHSLFSSI